MQTYSHGYNHCNGDGNGDGNGYGYRCDRDGYFWLWRCFVSTDGCSCCYCWYCPHTVFYCCGGMTIIKAIDFGNKVWY